MSEFSKVTTDEEIFKVLHKWTNRIATKASDFYAPKGWSNQLSGNIEAQKPYRDGKYIYGVIATEAIHNGESYAKKQHDENLLHVSSQPLKKSFHQFGGSEGTLEQRYWRGLYSVKKSGGGQRYATQFFTKALDDYQDKMLDELQEII
jgi:hypothetical protein